MADIDSGFILLGILANRSVTASLCDSRIGKIYKTLTRRAQLSENDVEGISGQ